MSEQPRLVVRGQESTWASALTHGLTVAIPVALLAVLAGPRNYLVDGLVWRLPFAIGGLVVSTVGLGALLRWRQNRGGWVEFRAFAIVFHKGGELLASVRWADISGFSDDSADFVKVHARTSVFPAGWLTVPTPTEDVRTAVLALLVERGIPRRER